MWEMVSAEAVPVHLEGEWTNSLNKQMLKGLNSNTPNPLGWEGLV